jgi:hypothetical protein
VTEELGEIGRQELPVRRRNRARRHDDVEECPTPGAAWTHARPDSQPDEPP